MPSSPEYPRIRSVEAFPADEEGITFAVMDPTGIAETPLSLSRAAMFVLGLMDGCRSVEEIRKAFLQSTGQVLPAGQLELMIQQLDAAHYLDSPRFAEHYNRMVAAYRMLPVRESLDPASLGAADGGLPQLLDELLDHEMPELPDVTARLVGLVAPHLDYPRGAPNYARAYGILRQCPPPERIIVLGTNHFGQATGPVATRKHFRTPLGTTRTDAAFIKALEHRLGVDLCEREFDHKREHSVELQLLICQHLLGCEAFELVPILCHDASTPSGTAPYDGQGADLADLGRAMAESIDEDDRTTLVIAGADLSHIGFRFGDECDLDVPFLREIEQHDLAALGALCGPGEELFLDYVRQQENRTRICSTGCLYTLSVALRGARRQLLGYHQAIDADSGTGVTSCAMAFWS